MNFGWYIEVLKKYAVFEGRARREEFWMYSLVNLLVAIVLYFISPTIYAAAGIKPPTCVDGVQQQPIDGIALNYSFNAAHAADQPGPRPCGWDGASPSRDDLSTTMSAWRASQPGNAHCAGRRLGHPTDHRGRSARARSS